MPDYKFDFSKITLREYRNMMDSSRPNEEADELTARVAGLEPAQLEDMSFEEWRRFMRLFFDAAKHAGEEEKN